MRKLVLVVLTFMFAIGLSVAVHAAMDNFETEKGDTVYVCSCGEACTCGTMSTRAGECGCGKALIKSTVTKVENGRVYYMVDGKELSAPQKGAYHCACRGCDCNTVSQKPGKCSCGKKMMKEK